MVVFHHARSSVPDSANWFEFGASGVDVFFVISGFVMAHTARSLDIETIGIRVRSAAHFIFKRILRVVPLYWLALIWTSRRELSEGRFGTGLVKDFFFLPRLNPTYPDMLWPSVIQGWTLNYEMFFYVLFAVAMLAGRYRYWVLLGTLTSLVILGVDSSLWDTLSFGATLPAESRFYTNDILLEFVYGVILQRVFCACGYPRWPKWPFFLAMCSGFVLLAIGFDRPLRGVFVGLPALVIVWAAIPIFADMRLPKWQLLGDASYAIYLFHWASFGLAHPVAAKLTALTNQSLQPFALTALLISLYLSIAVISGIFIHLFLERPFSRHASNWLRMSPLGATR